MGMARTRLVDLSEGQRVYNVALGAFGCIVGNSSNKGGFTIKRDDGNIVEWREIHLVVVSA